MLVVHFSKMFQVDFVNSVTIRPECKKMPFKFADLKCDDIMTNN